MDLPPVGNSKSQIPNFKKDTGAEAPNRKTGIKSRTSHGLPSAQSLTLRQAANYQCGFLRGCGLTQGQALQNLPAA
jgi:hypothetical protein